MRNSAKRSLQSIVLASSLALPFYQGCSRPSPEEQQFTQITYVWGDSWKTLNQETQKELKERYLTDENTRKNFNSVYLHPESIFSEMTQEQRDEYGRFTLTSLSDEKKTEYKEIWPWVNFEEPSENDKLWVFCTSPIYEMVKCVSENDSRRVQDRPSVKKP